MTQNETILMLLQRGERLTAKYVNDKYGITRLASRICDLKKMDIKIDRRQIRVKSRYGDGYSYVSEYKLREST